MLICHVWNLVGSLNNDDWVGLGGMYSTMPFIPQEPEKSYPAPNPCMHPEHNPPNMMVLPPGVHVWRCPACGQEVTINKPEYFL